MNISTKKLMKQMNCTRRDLMWVIVKIDQQLVNYGDGDLAGMACNDADCIALISRHLIYDNLRLCTVA